MELQQVNCNPTIRYFIQNKMILLCEDTIWIHVPFQLDPCKALLGMA